MTTQFLYSPTDEEDQRKAANRETIKRIAERHKAAQEAAAETNRIIEEAKPKRKRRTPGKKRTLEPIDKKNLEVAIVEDGHTYNKPADLVIYCRSLSMGAKAVYWFIESKCFNGKRDRKGNWIEPPRWSVILGREEIADTMRCDEDKVTEFIAELRAHGFVYRKQRGHRMYHEYELPLRRRRIDHEAEMEKKREIEKVITPKN